MADACASCLADTLASLRLVLPSNWTTDGLGQTERGSLYAMLFGRIQAPHAEREPVIILHRNHDADAWKATPGRHYIDADRTPLGEGSFRAVAARAVRLADEQNERWAAIPGFELPRGDT